MSEPAPGDRAPLSLTAVAVLGVLLAVAATVMPAGAAQARRWPGHPDRRIVVHVVRPGETATGLSVRYHAWTREFVRLNGRRLLVGQRVRIPVVVSAARKAARKDAHRAARHHRPERGHRPRHHSGGAHSGRHRWTHAELSRPQVRGVLTRVAKRYGVPVPLTLAVAWQESGWQQRRVSSTGALGVMQVMPATGRWMRLYFGRPMRLRDTYDNIRAGVMTLKVLRAHTRRDRRAIAAYYQGLGAVQSHGLYPSTRRYVAAVRAHQQRIRRTGSPV